MIMNQQRLNDNGPPCSSADYAKVEKSSHRFYSREVALKLYNGTKCNIRIWTLLSVNPRALAEVF